LESAVDVLYSGHHSVNQGTHIPADLVGARRKAVEMLAHSVSTGKQPIEHTVTASTSLPPLNDLKPRNL